VREKIRNVTHWGRWGRRLDLDEVIADLNPILQRWGNYFRTGNASRHFNAIDRYVTERLWGLLRRRRCHLGRGRARTVVPPQVSGKPCAGKRHTRFERGPQVQPLNQEVT